MDVGVASINEIQAYEQAKGSKYTKINTPFGYFGSKNKIALQLAQQLPPHNCWVEAFCGSSALTLAKPPSMIEVINDIDYDIVNFFKQLRNNEAELIRMVELTPYSRVELENARICSIEDSELERARKFLVQSMMAINGVFGEVRGGFSYSQSYSRNGKDARVNRWVNLPERLNKVVKRLRDVRVERKDAAELLEMFANRPASLVYLDPPYLAKRTKGYNNDQYEEEFHHNLLKTAGKCKCMIFISGYDNELYNDMLSEERGWSKKTIYTITKGSNGSSFNRSEVVWTNSYYDKALALNKVPLRLTKKEIRENKVNPERK